MKTIITILSLFVTLITFSQSFYYDTQNGTLTDGLGVDVSGQSYTTCSNPNEVLFYISTDSNAVNPLVVSFTNTTLGTTFSTTYSLFDLNFNWLVIPETQFLNWLNAGESGVFTFTSGTNQVTINFTNVNDIDQTNLITNIFTCPNDTVFFSPSSMGALNVSSWYLFDFMTGSLIYPDSTGLIPLGLVPYELTMISSAGCESNAFINVTVLNTSSSTSNVSVCFGSQYLSPQGNNYGAGTYTETYTAANGCDSIVTINVTELPQISGVSNVAICPNTQYSSPQGNNYGVGTYTETYTATNGCDSIVTINVTELNDTLIDISFINPSGCGTNDGQIFFNGLLADSSYCIYFDNDTTGIKDMYLADSLGVITIDSLGAGTYQNFMMQNPCGLNIYDSTTIIQLVEPNPITPVTTASQDTICLDLGESATLSVVNQNDYNFIEWLPVSSSNPFTTFTGGVFYASLIDINNCPILSDTITIIQVEVCNNDTSGLAEIEIGVVKTEYYNLLGQKLDDRPIGSYFEITTFENGAQSSKLKYRN